MFRPLIISTFLIAFLVGACAKHELAQVVVPAHPAEFAPEPGIAEPHQEHYRTSEDAAAAVTGSQAYCKDKRNCHDSVAFLLTRIGTQLNMCSASLVGPKLVMTNSHCVPKELKRGEVACSESVVAHYPETANLPAQTQKCAKLLYFSAYPAIDGARIPDFAFFEMAEEVRRPVLEIDRKGFPDGLEVTILKVNPIVTEFFPVMGEVEVIRCKTVMKTIQQPQFDHPEFPLASFSHCPIMKGNSGSVILAPDGKVRGVIQSFLDPATLSPELVQKHFLPGAVGSNLACIALPGENVRFPEQCSAVISAETNTRRMTEIHAEVSKPRMDEIMLKFREWHRQNHGGMSWTLKIDSDPIPSKRWFTPTPRCLVKGWPLDPTGRVSKTLPQYSKRLVYDEELRLVLKPEVGSERQVSSALEFAPSEFAQTGELKLSQKVFTPHGDLTIQSVMKACN